MPASKFYLIAVRFTLGFCSNTILVITDLADIQCCSSHLEEGIFGSKKIRHSFCDQVWLWKWRTRTGKGREKILVLEMCCWGSEVCQLEGQAGLWGEGVIAMSHQGLQPLKKQLVRFTCPLAEVSLGDLGLEGTWDRSFESAVRVTYHVHQQLRW